MICPSIPPSASHDKVSGANWLDRLRSSRGFPPADAVDLDHFIAGQNPPSAASAELPRLPSLHPVDESSGCQNGGRSGEDVSDILCDLFAMGGAAGRGEISNRVGNRKRSSRKQQNPRFWDATGSSKKSSNGVSSHNNKSKSNNLDCNNNGLASSGDYSLNQHRKERDSKEPGELGLEVEEEKVDLKGYSKSEVTVIDSSIQGWRAELFVFRKRKSKSVWKVREKTSKSRNLVNARRKRKFSKPNSGENDDDDDNGDAMERREKKMKKKMTLRVSDSAPGNMFNNGNGKEDAAVPLMNEGRVQDDKVDQTLKGVGYLRGEASVKSSHWKSKSESSSVILIKPLPTLDKSVTRKPGKISSVNKGETLL